MTRTEAIRCNGTGPAIAALMRLLLGRGPAQPRASHGGRRTAGAGGAQWVALSPGSSDPRHGGPDRPAR